MNGRRRKLVVLGMMTKIPVAGVVWQTVHYLLGFRRLGFDVYYVESHARTPSMLMETERDDGSALAAGFIDRVLRRFDLRDRWAYVALHDDGRHLGLSEGDLRRLYASAELIVNLHGGTEPRPEHADTGRLVYVETDPVQLQVELAEGLASTITFLEPHCAFFTFGENYGAADCLLPVSERFHFLPTRQPVVLDLWPRAAGDSGRFTTVANWRQNWREVRLGAETYRWSKHLEFERVLDLPRRTGRSFTLVLSGCERDERERLRRHGWSVRDATALSVDMDAYRSYVAGSLGELTVAKDQNVRLRTGWFSDRSATYLASGRPVITQDTAFGNVLPTGAGLHAFSTEDEAAAAVEHVCADYGRERAAAGDIAQASFDSDVVLGRLLDDVGVPRLGHRRRSSLREDLVLTPDSRRPLRLPRKTVEAVLEQPVPFPDARAGEPHASIVVVTHDNLALTRLCLESVLASTDPVYELVVIDNDSQDGTRSYLLTLARRAAHVRVLLNESNPGFPAACNQGLAAARGDVLVLLNNDTIVAPGWLDRLAGRLDDPKVGLVGPVTNRIGNEAEIPVVYETYGELIAFATQRASGHAGQEFDIRMPAMFCLALRRDTWERLGPLDERFGVGTLEDDDYALRSAAAGYRNVCADDVFIHHFGEASFGSLFASGAYSELIDENRRRFEEKWGVPWQPYDRRRNDEYRALTENLRRTLTATLPRDATVIVVSKGDDALLELDGRTGVHFPQAEDGCYAGHYPADSSDAIAHLESLRDRGGSHFVLPRTGFWWLDHYDGLREHLKARYVQVHRDAACVVYSLKPERSQVS
jgi:GT2 family glycosyltransferase